MARSVLAFVSCSFDYSLFLPYTVTIKHDSLARTQNLSSILHRYPELSVVVIDLRSEVIMIEVAGDDIDLQNELRR